MFKNKRGFVRAGWHLAGAMGALYGLIFLLNFLASFAAIAWLTATGEYDPATGALTGRGAQLNDILFYMLMFLQEAAMIAVPLLAWNKLCRQPLAAMGLPGPRGFGRDFWMGIGLAFASITVVFAGIVLTGSGQVAYKGFSPDLLLWLALFIAVGFAEEILGRGYVMAILRRTGSLAAVYVVSGLIFALMHGGNNGFSPLAFANIFLVGVLFADMYIQTGTIWMSIGYHILWNYAQGCIYGFSVSGLDTQGILVTAAGEANLLNGGAFGPEGGLFVTLVIALGAMFVRWYCRGRGQAQGFICRDYTFTQAAGRQE